MAITDEDHPAYHAHVESYMQAFNPQNQPQSDVVRLAANALWRTDRLTTIEASLLELEIEWNTPFTDASLSGLETRHHIAIAFVQNLTEGSNALDLCRRYLSSAQRDFHLAITTFEKLKELTSPVQIPEPQPVPEPVPEPEPAPAAAPEAQQPPDGQPEPSRSAPKLQLVQRDPNELTPKPADRSSQPAQQSGPGSKLQA